ncbi:uncharacterized protein EV154DRAFT_476798 [Mucor mucedo]|uniref:uncharacterized protein n=1 Tax=Mucor mucedo TaxID=29922 RepID=UPI00221FC581|nr:uncharacterized protein EV154DRAFT_476798 [Mucor mucedo]KAI7896078.1 hypothetical protein EV154DRAFT_476798 [Mucor mucedo]
MGSRSFLVSYIERLRFGKNHDQSRVNLHVHTNYTAMKQEVMSYIEGNFASFSAVRHFHLTESELYMYRVTRREMRRGRLFAFGMQWEYIRPFHSFIMDASDTNYLLCYTGRSSNQIYNQNSKVKKLPDIKRHVTICSYCIAYFGYQGYPKNIYNMIQEANTHSNNDNDNNNRNIRGSKFRTEYCEESEGEEVLETSSSQEDFEKAAYNPHSYLSLMIFFNLRPWNFLHAEGLNEDAYHS